MALWADAGLSYRSKDRPGRRCSDGDDVEQGGMACNATGAPFQCQPQPTQPASFLAATALAPKCPKQRLAQLRQVLVQMLLQWIAAGMWLERGR
eukprot:1157532-Pelagomonas_calceolata.AAC.5